MKFHVSFTYQTDEREKLLNFLRNGGLESDGLKLLGAWIAVQTGTGYAIVDSRDGNAVYELCSRWSEYGQLSVTPVIDAASV